MVVGIKENAIVKVFEDVHYSLESFEIKGITFEIKQDQIDEFPYAEATFDVMTLCSTDPSREFLMEFLELVDGTAKVAKQCGREYAISFARRLEKAAAELRGEIG